MGMTPNEKAMSMSTRHITELESLHLVGVSASQEAVPTHHWAELQEALSTLGVGDLIPSPEDPAVLRTIVPVYEGTKTWMDSPLVESLEVVVMVPQNPVEVAPPPSRGQLDEALAGMLIFVLLTVGVFVGVNRRRRTLKEIPENDYLMWSMRLNDGDGSR